MSFAPITSKQLAQLVQSLPASPQLLAELAPRLQQVEVPVTDVTESIRRDPALTARLIAISNSTVYARAEPATSLEEAVTCIGYAEVYRLIGALAASHMADEPLTAYRIESRRFRDNALFVALVTEELAAASGVEPRTAYTVGLLRSIGKVALDRLARTAATPVAPIDGEQPVLEWEQATFGTTNPVLAAQILELWRFPAETVNAVRDHYAPSSQAPALMHLLNLAAGAADLRGFGFTGEESYWQFAPESFAAAGVDEGKLVWAGERAFRALTRICDALA